MLIAFNAPERKKHRDKEYRKTFSFFMRGIANRVNAPNVQDKNSCYSNTSNQTS